MSISNNCSYCNIKCTADENEHPLHYHWCNETLSCDTCDNLICYDCQGKWDIDTMGELICHSCLRIEVQEKGDRGKRFDAYFVMKKYYEDNN